MGGTFLVSALSLLLLLAGFLFSAPARAITSQKLVPLGGQADDGFGSSVSVSGNVAVVGAPMDDDLGDRAGAAYVFRFNGTAWVQEVKLTATDGTALDYFGAAVGVSGDRIAIGAPFDEGSAARSGSVYVFRADAATWVQEDKLQSSDVSVVGFGGHVAISHSTILVGPSSRPGGGGRTKFVLPFRLSGSSWVEDPPLLPSGNVSDMALSGETAVVARSDQIHFFRFDGTSWLQQVQVACTFGCFSAGISGDAAIFWDLAGPGVGSAHVLRFDGTTWVPEASVEGSGVGIVAISGSTVLFRDGSGSTGRVFRFDGSAWTESAGVGVPQSGWASASISGDTALIASIDQAGTSSVDIFAGVSKASPSISYVALGDSYSSGEGVEPYEDGTEPGEVDTDSDGNMCHRSRQAYSRFVKPPTSRESLFQAATRGEPGFEWRNASCSSATTFDVRFQSQFPPTQPPQVQQLGPDVGMVTITVGGNDAFFGDVLKWCMFTPLCHLWGYPGETLEDILRRHVSTTVRIDLTDTYRRIREASPEAAIFVLGYPQLVSGTDDCGEVSLGPADLEEGEQQFLRRMVVRLNEVAADAADVAGVHFVGTAARFGGHELCGDLDDWFFAIGSYGVLPWSRFLYPAKSKEVAHPNAMGQREYVAAMHEFIASKTPSNWPTGFLPSGLPRNPDSLPAAPLALSVTTPQSTQAASMIGTLVVEAAQPPPCENPLAFVRNQDLRLRGTGFAAGASVSVVLTVDSFTAEIGPLSASSQGSIDAISTIPASTPAPGVGSLVASGVSAGSAIQSLLTAINLGTNFADDTDQDGVPDTCDNCSDVPGAGQADTDGDGRGDLCDVCPGDLEDDWDGDGLCSSQDACPLDSQNDVDGDGFCADSDNCRNVFNPEQFDADSNGYGDDCPVTPECGDGLDNDLDGLVDFGSDPGCDTAADGAEKSTAWACDDGVDNDADGLTDYRTDGLGDPGCRKAAVVRENPQCDDDQDNDGQAGVDWDGGIDGGAPDPQCSGVPWSNREQQQQVGCGLSYELAPVVLGLGWLRRRRRLQPMRP